MEYIAFDSHKRYTLALVQELTGEHVCEIRVNHERGSIKESLRRWEPGSPVAVETIGNWYWIVDEIEEAGMLPLLVHAHKAKLMLGMVNKTDKLGQILLAWIASPLPRGSAHTDIPIQEFPLPIKRCIWEGPTNRTER